MLKLYLWTFSYLLVLLGWVLTSFLPPLTPPLVNYDETVYFSHENLRVPSSKKEIADIVMSAALHGQKIRVIGSGHSWSGIAKPQDILVSLHKLKGLVRIDKEKYQVTVRAGTTLKELNHQLELQGLAMNNLPSISEQTVAGAIMTEKMGNIKESLIPHNLGRSKSRLFDLSCAATHGTGVDFGNLATYVTKLELISGRGELLTASAADKVDIFKAAQVSVGVLGIITEVTFQCKKAFNLEETLVTHPLHFCLENLEQIVKSAEHVKFWIDLHSGTCATFLSNRTTEKPRDHPNLFVENLKMKASEAFIYIISWFPRAVPTLMRLLFQTEVIVPHNRVDISYRVFNIPHYFPVHNEAEVVVGINDCVAAIRALKQVVDNFHIPLNYLTEVRFVGKDDIWLSPNYQRDSCHITQTIYNPSESKRQLYFNEFHNATRKFGARLHWGKDFNLTPTEIRSLYPKFGDFMRIRALLDPNGTFLNELMSRTFGSLESNLV